MCKVCNSPKLSEVKHEVNDSVDIHLIKTWWCKSPCLLFSISLETIFFFPQVESFVSNLARKQSNSLFFQFRARVLNSDLSKSLFYHKVENGSSGWITIAWSLYFMIYTVIFTAWILWLLRANFVTTINLSSGVTKMALLGSLKMEIDLSC